MLTVAILNGCIRFYIIYFILLTSIGQLAFNLLNYIMEI